jgi:hypothetical protein
MANQDNSFNSPSNPAAKGQVMRQIKAKYVVGLTATPTRKDGHHPIIIHAVWTDQI